MHAISSTTKLANVLSLLLVTGLSYSESASAVFVPAPQFLYFNAQCTDCAAQASVSAYSVVATLALNGYGYGSPLDLSNVASFSYSGSNLVAPSYGQTSLINGQSPPAAISIYSVAGWIDSLDGLTPSSGSLSIDYGGNHKQFNIYADGHWAYFNGNAQPNDVGFGTWSLTAASVGPTGMEIPEPATLPLALTCGFLTILALRQQRVRDST